MGIRNPFIILTGMMAAALFWNCSDSSNSTGPPIDTAQGPSESGFAETILDPEYLPKPWGKALGDVDGDGRGDVFLARGHGLGRLSWFEAPPDPLKGAWKEHFIDSAAYVHRLHLADVDDDGDLDLIFAEQHEAPRKRVGIFRNDDGAGLKWSYIGIADKGAHNIAVGDIGKDGDLDVLGANWTGDTRPRLWIKESN